MQPREKLLATALAVILAVFVLRPVFDSLFLEPLRDRDATIKSAQIIVSGLEARDFQLKRAQRSLAGYRARSLPPMAVDAQREYSEWLTDLALLSNWRNPQVTHGSRTPRGPATMIPVKIKGQATLDDVNQFLLRFDATALLHRVVNLELTSPGFEGNPLLDVDLTAEGVAMSDAAPRTRLFPTAELARAIDADDETIPRAGGEEFPNEAPFFIRLDRELLEVRSVSDDEWTVARGVTGTQPVEHGAETPIELLPMREVVAAAGSLPAVQRLFVRSPDAGTLQLGAELTPAVRGRAWTAALSVQNWDPDLGPVQLKLSGGAPAGMTIDPADNALHWVPPDDFPLGTIDVRVAALGRGSNAPVIESDLKVEVRRPNSPPELTIPDELDVWLGRPWRYELTAADPDLPNDTLTYSLGGNVPAGLTINGATGVLSWSPSADMDLGDFEVEVTVKDSGVPPESVRRTLTLKLADDNALYTYFTGTIAVGGNWEAWLYDRSTNRLTVVRAGQEFQVADVSGKAVHIDEGAMDIESGGRTYRLTLGQNLRNWVPTSGEAGPTSPDKTGSSGNSPET